MRINFIISFLMIIGLYSINNLVSKNLKLSTNISINKSFNARTVKAKQVKQINKSKQLIVSRGKYQKPSYELPRTSDIKNTVKEIKTKYRNEKLEKVSVKESRLTDYRKISFSPASKFKKIRIAKISNKKNNDVKIEKFKEVEIKKIEIASELKVSVVKGFELEIISTIEENHKIASSINNNNKKLVKNKSIIKSPSHSNDSKKLEKEVTSQNDQLFVSGTNLYEKPKSAEGILTEKKRAKELTAGLSVKDVVKTKLSASMTQQSSKAINDLVFYSYADEKSESKAKANDSGQEVQKKKSQTVALENKKESAVTNDEIISYYNNQTKNEYSKNNNALSIQDTDQLFDVEYSIVVNLKDKSIERALNYDVKAMDGSYDELYSSTEDGVSGKEKLANEYNIRRFRVESSDLYPTSIDFVLFEGDNKEEIYTFSKEGFSNLIKSNGLRGLGGHYLVRLSKDTEDVIIDKSTSYEAKIYLDYEMNVVSPGDSEYSFILYLGVQAGNAVVTFKKDDSRESTKIVFIDESEILFEPNYYYNEKSETLSFYEEGVLSKKQFELNVDKTDVNSFSSVTKKEQKNLNSIEFINTLYTLGSRKYFVSRHIRDYEVFFGTWSNNKITLPTETFRNFVLSGFGLNKLGGRCLVQVNLDGKIKKHSVEGFGPRGSMRLDYQLLDDDGKFYDEYSNYTKKLFILGETQGVINLKLEYVNGSSTYIQTFCSQDTYLVEQL